MGRNSGGGGRGGRIRKGSFVTDGLVRGIVKGKGTIGRNIPAYRVDIGGGRTTLMVADQARRVG